MEENNKDNKQKLSDLLISITQDLSFIKESIGELETIKSEVNSLKDKTNLKEKEDKEEKEVKEEKEEKEKNIDDKETKDKETKDKDIELSDEEVEELDKFFNEY